MPVGAAALAVVLALVLGTGLTTVVVRRSPGAEPAAVATTPAAPDTPDSVRAALEERVLAPPKPTERLPDAQNGLGLLSAEGVLALAGGSEQDRASAARGLELLGFREALGRAWSTGDRVYVVLVYRFAAPEGANGLVQGLRTRLPGPAFRSRTVPSAVAYTGRSDRFFEQHGSFARGRYVYEVTLLTPAQDRRHARFDALLERQSTRAARLDP